MYTIAGVTGHVGSVVAARLLDEGVPVRVLVRDRAQGHPWIERGAEAVVVDLADRAGLTKALAGSAGFFALLPFDPTTNDFRGDSQRLIASISAAVTNSGVPHVAMLSSIGADLTEGTGPILDLHRLEEALRATPAVVSAVRSGHFQERVADVLDAARHEGIYPVFAESADVPKSNVATRDIGGVIARILLSPPQTDETIDLEGPQHTEREVAEILGRVLGRSLEVVTLPRAAWSPTLVDAGFSPDVADVLAGLYDADDRGVLAPRGDRSVRCDTALETTIAGLVGIPV